MSAPSSLEGGGGGGRHRAHNNNRCMVKIGFKDIHDIRIQMSYMVLQELEIGLAGGGGGNSAATQNKAVKQQGPLQVCKPYNSLTISGVGASGSEFDPSVCPNPTTTFCRHSLARGVCPVQRVARQDVSTCPAPLAAMPAVCTLRLLLP